MSKSKKHLKKTTSKKSQPNHLVQINPNVAGIDIGCHSHFVASPIDSGEIEVKEFSSVTSGLQDLSAWLKQSKVTSVIMESTGIYWIPLYELLESQGFDVKLVNARHVKNVTGRKTDVLDCQWLQQLGTYGLLNGAFRPKDEILPLRAYTRERQSIIINRSIHTARMHKTLSTMNIKLSSVVNDITGLTGMQIIRAIVDGERDPKKLAMFRDVRCKKNVKDIEEALKGNFREEHLYILKSNLEAYDFCQKQLLDCDSQIEKTLHRLNPEDDDKKHNQSLQEKSPRDHRTKEGNAPSFDPSEHLKAITGVDLLKVPGIQTNTAVKLISEVGIDMKRWKTANHFTSWLGLCPENKISGGKQLSSKTKPTNNYAAQSFRFAAFALGKSKTSLGAFFRRIQSKHGAVKAMTATARKIAVIFYNMLSKGIEYVEAGQEHYETQYKERVIKSMAKRAADLGFVLVPADYLNAQVCN